MDSFSKAFNLVQAYNQHKGNLNELIIKVCEYFDYIKDKTITQADIKFLMFIANKIGIPQFVDLLKNNYQQDKFNLKDIDLSTFTALIGESSLQLSENVKVHRYQKQVLDKFRSDKKNRYILSAPTSFGKTFIVYEIIKKLQYSNIMLIFPTISLLSENYMKLLMMSKEVPFFENFKIHSLSDIQDLGKKNIWVFTPERFLSYIDKIQDQSFDFVFIERDL